MLLSTSDGISCDVCGTIHRKKFVYYAMDSSSIVIDTTKRTSGIGSIKSSYDICSICYDKWIGLCKVHINDIRPGHIKCDLCPRYLVGQFEYIRAIFTKADVSSENGEFDVQTEPKFMDFNLCITCYKLIETTVKQKVAKKDEWS